jgi:hypothetical protein
MSVNVQFIWKKIEHLQRMKAYLDNSLEQALVLMPIQCWQQLTLPQHATLAAFRVRFSEFQEHLGKAMGGNCTRGRAKQGAFQFCPELYGKTWSHRWGNSGS